MVYVRNAAPAQASVCDNDPDVQQGLVHDGMFKNQCVFQNVLELH